MRKKEARSPSGSDRGLLSTNMLSYDTEQLDKTSQNTGQREYSILHCVYDTSLALIATPTHALKNQNKNLAELVQ